MCRLQVSYCQEYYSNVQHIPLSCLHRQPPFDDPQPGHPKRRTMATVAWPAVCGSLLGGHLQIAGLILPKIYNPCTLQPPQLPPQAAHTWRSPAMTFKMQDSGHSFLTCSLCEPPWRSRADFRSHIAKNITAMSSTSPSAASTSSPQLLVQSGSGCSSMGALQSRTKKFKICVPSFKHPTTSKPICSQFLKPYFLIFSLLLTQRTNSPS